MNSVKIEVGQVWVGKTTRAEKEILAVGKEKVFFANITKGYESTTPLSGFFSNHTLKKPEPKLTKLVALINKAGDCHGITNESNNFYEHSAKKQIIVKELDGELQLFVKE